MLTTLLYLILAVLIITTLFVVVRTLVFQRRQGAVKAIEGVPVDDQQVAEHLAASVRCKTVPLDDKGTPDPEAFAAASQDARGDLPAGAQKLKREVINGYSLLYTWQGSRPDLEPVMLMAHQDVVSADPAEWTHPPFDGVIVDGVIWGRGTLDIKNQLIGIMDAAETLLRAGLPSGAHHPVWLGARRGDRRGQRLQDHGADAQGARHPPGRDRG